MDISLLASAGAYGQVRYRASCSKTAEIGDAWSSIEERLRENDR